MAELVVLKAQKREILGTGSSRAIRKKGMIPAEIYGNGKENISISLPENEVTRLYRKPSFTSTIIQIDVDGKSYKVLPKSVQLHPINDLVHTADFMHLASETQRVAVPLLFSNLDKSIGIKRGGFFNISKRKVILICDVNKIPANIEFDMEKMRVGSSIRAHDLTIPDGCKLVCADNFFVASITGRGSKDETDEATTTATPAAATKGKK
jgi:large subunit ribosomal protein L25